MGLRAGDLNKRVTIEELAPFKDPVTGEVSNVWQPVASPDVWAKIRPTSVRDLLLAGIQSTNIVASVVVRFRASFQGATLRVRHGERVYKVEGVLPDPDSGTEYMTMPVSEFLHTLPEDR